MTDETFFKNIYQSHLQYVRHETVFVWVHLINPPLSLPSRIQVRLGEHNIAVNEGTEQFIDSVKVIMHPSYNSRNLDNDIMLIKLSKPASLNSYVSTVALPSSCASSGTRCLVSGWGNLSGSSSE